MEVEKKELYTAKRPSGLNTSEINLEPVVCRLKADEGDVNWMLMTVSGANALELCGCGDGGFDELVTNLNDSIISYGVFKCLVAGSPKFFHLFFVGPDVSAMKKGKGSMNKNAIFQLIEAHGEVQCASGKESFTREFLLEELAKTTRVSAGLIQLL